MCLNPHTIYRLCRKNYKGERVVVWSRKHMYKNDVIYEELQVPCGKCFECLMARARDWSLRCMLEAQDYKINGQLNACFLTLTYKDSLLPRNPLCSTLRYKDVQLFLKRLRKSLNSKIKIRYFCSGEYGSKTFRPHYHMILYGITDPNAVFFRKSYSGLPIYRSKFFEDFWQQGFVFYGSVTFNSCGYVARYCLDKNKRKKDDIYFNFRDNEFVHMSKGIGLNWLLNNYRSLQKQYFINFDSKKYSIPRYFMKKLEQLYPKLYKIIKNTKQFFMKLKNLKLTLEEKNRLLDTRLELNKSRLLRLRRMFTSDDVIHLIE